MTALWGFLGADPYLVMFAMALIEGPIATVLAGSWVGAGRAWLPAAWLAVVLADLVADIVWFSVGRFGRREGVARHLPRLGLTPERRERLEGALGANLPKVLLGAKVADVAAVPVLLAAGLSGVPLRRFLAWNLGITAVKSSVLLAVGMLVGASVAAHLPTGALVALGVAVEGTWLLLALLRKRSRARAAAAAA